MLRITESDNVGNSACLKVEGRIVGNLTTEFEHACEIVLAQGQFLVLDFSDVRFVDGRGLAALKRLLARQVQIIKIRPLVQILLYGRDKDLGRGDSRNVETGGPKQGGKSR